MLDYRGFETGAGWRHGVAHGADLLLQLWRAKWLMLLVFAVCAAPVVASYLTYYVIRPEGRSNYAALIDPAREMPAEPCLALGEERRDVALRVVPAGPTARRPPTPRSW